MGKFDEKISDKSIWATATPTQAALSLPFYVTEAGHFYAEADYEVSRENHDSFLMLYTLGGCGIIQSGGTSFKLAEGRAAVIDCHIPHRYRSDSAAWEFIWIHIKGSAVLPMLDILYPNGPASIPASERLPELSADIISKIRRSDILSGIEVSSSVHELFNELISGSLQNEKSKNKGRYYDFVKSAAEFMRAHYSEPLSIDEIIKNIPMSKYHFIRTFKRIMGTTPYNYLTNHRINSAKILLRTTDMQVSEIAERCGFLDTSNFIIQFKKSTLQKPLQYRRDFSAV